jgi:hypothetical protein
MSVNFIVESGTGWWFSIPSGPTTTNAVGLEKRQKVIMVLFCRVHICQVFLFSSGFEVEST